MIFPIVEAMFVFDSYLLRFNLVPSKLFRYIIGMHDDRSHSLMFIIICHYVHYKYTNKWSQIIID